MDNKQIDRMSKLKQFIMRIYEPGLVAGNNFKNGEFLRVLSLKEDSSNVEFFNNVDDMIDFCTSKRMNYKNVYFSISTTNGKDGKLNNLSNSYTLAFDFDKKSLPDGFNHKDVLNRFRNIKLKYHALIDSGNGYHAYVLIEQCDDLKKVNNIMKSIAEKLGSDLDAAKKTQIMRVPMTYNCKEKERRKLARVIFVEDKDKLQRYTIEHLYNEYCLNKSKRDAVNVEYLQKDTNVKPCVREILDNGSKESCNNKDLQKIVVELRYRNKSLAHIKELVKEWNLKNEVMWSESELKYQTEYMYEKLHYAEYNCDNCNMKKECKTVSFSNFEFTEDSNTVQMSETHMKYLKKSNRKGVKIMEGNDLVIYTLLKNHVDGLTREEIIKELTYKNKCLLSKNTLTKALKNLEENEFIGVTNIGKYKSLYKLKEIRSKVELKYLVSFSVTYECIKGNITTEELRLYNFMRYIHNKEQRENPEALQGNLLQISQKELGKEFGVTQQRISKMISNLMEEKIISPYYRGKSKNNGFEFYVYRLNY